MRADRATRVSLAVTLLLVVSGLLAFQGAETARSAGKRLGFAPEQGPAGVLVARVSPGRPAGRDGLRAGDLLLEVNGAPIPNIAAYEVAAERFEPGRPVTLRIRRGESPFLLTVIPGTPPLWGLFLFNGLIALGYVGVALLSLPPILTDLRARLLFGFTAAVAVELILPVDAVGRPWLGTAAIAAYYLLTGLQASLELHLASLIPQRPAWLRARPWLVPLYYLAGAAVGVTACATFLSEELSGRQVLPWTSLEVNRLLQGFGLPAWALAVVLLLASQAFRHPEPEGRHQAGLVLAGTLPWLLFVATSTALQRTGIPLPPWAAGLEALILLCHPVAFFLAIFRYHLFDLELVVRRGLIYTALTGALALVFYAALGAGGALVSLLMGEQDSVWSVSAATLLLGLVFAPLRRALHQVIGRRFFPERYALRQRLIALAGELPALGKLPLMGRHLVERLVTIFAVRSAALLVADPEARVLNGLAATGAQEPPLLIDLDDPGLQHLVRARRPLPVEALSPRFPETSLLVPLLLQDRLIGLLIVGRKEEAGAWPAEELDLLNLLAHHAATVFENARLFESATYEGLTGLLRREIVLAQLNRELERALRYSRPLAVALADLDHFKAVNDRHGHLAGDTLLKRTAQALAGELRSTDWIGRYGGEEFLLVFPETDLEGAAGVAEKVRSRVQEMAVPLDDGSLLQATVSIGLAALEETGSQDHRTVARDLLAAADRSLYAAKDGGRNRVHPQAHPPDLSPRPPEHAPPL